MFSKSLFLLLTTSLVTLTHALPSETVLPQNEPPHSTRSCGSADASIQMAQTCAGFSQQSVLFTTTEAISDDVLNMIGDAVKASGGSVGQKYGMKGFKGLSINAPTKVLDLVEAFGASHGLKMEANCKAHIMPFVPKDGGPRRGSTGGPGIEIGPAGYHRG